MWNKTDGIYIWALCNAKCEFCIEKWTTWEKSLYSYEEIINRIDNLYDEWVVDCITYEWWDFSLHPDILKILDYGNKKWFEQTFQTNWLKLWDEKFVEEINQRINTINFSLHAWNKEKYDEIMWTINWFEKVIKWIKNCKKLWMKVNMNFVIYKNNIQELINVYYLCIKLWINQLWLLLFDPIKFHQELNNKLIPNINEIIVVINKIVSINKEITKKVWQEVLKIKFDNFPICITQDKNNIVNYDKFRKSREVVDKDPSVEMMKWIKDQELTYDEKCNKCLMKNSCPWIARIYIEKFWSDFIKIFN